MPIPCKFSNPAPASFNVGIPALQDTDGSSPSNGSANPNDASASFDSVLDKVDEPEAPAKSKASPSGSTSAALTGEQLAMMASMVMPNPVLVPPIAPPPLPETTDAVPSFKLMGAEGRNLPELLVGGANVLEYQMASTPALLSAPGLAAGGLQPAAPAVQPGTPLTSETRIPGTVPLVDPLAGLAVSTPATTDGVSAATSPASTGTETRTSGGVPPVDPLVGPTVSGPTTTADGGDQNPSQGSLPLNTTIPSPDAVTAAAQGVAANLPRPKLAGNERPEKSAGPALSLRPAGEKSSTVRGKNMLLSVDDEPVNDSIDKLGTVAANGGKTMDHETRNFPPLSAQGDLKSFGGLLGSGTSTTVDDLKTVSPSLATDLVHEIREIADSLWSVERNSVEVKFNFGEQERLSVRVEYRDGTVQATFRTNSSDVRDAITREWQAQSGAAEQRPYRVAEPVFVGAPPASGSSLGGDASRQQRSPEQQQPIPFERFNPGNASRSAPSPTTSPLVPSISPREMTGRLHALV